MEFRTSIKTSDLQGTLRHSDRIMLLGSCFSDNIGAKLRSAMMRVEINPFGTLYNPLSIASAVNRLISGEPVAGVDLFQAGGVWSSFDFHSRYSMPDKAAALQRMNERIAASHAFLAECDALVLTLGSAMVYRHKRTDRVVANCHKVPQHEFDRRLASISEMCDALTAMLRQLREFNPDLKVVFTISPIRHIADGLATNSLSKSMLRVALHEVEQAMPEAMIYFPSYEIMLDDLRDYRFYASDMLHPSEVAVEYIWQTFQATFFDDRSAQAVARCERVGKRLTHRPMSNSREVVERFQADTAAVVRNLVKEYPYLSELKEISEYLQ